MLFLRVIAWCGAEKFSLKKSCFYLYIRRKYECYRTSTGSVEPGYSDSRERYSTYFTIFPIISFTSYTGNEITEFKIQKDYIKLVRQIQDKMIQRLACRGIGIETNPSSNYLMRNIICELPVIFPPKEKRTK